MTNLTNLLRECVAIAAAEKASAKISAGTFTPYDVDDLGHDAKCAYLYARSCGVEWREAFRAVVCTMGAK